MTWFDSTWLDSWHRFSCSRHTVKLATFPRTRNAVCFGSQIGVCLAFWHGWWFFALGPTLWGARSFLELLVVVVVLVSFVQRVGLGWVRCGFCSCELWFTAFSSGRPGGELFFLFWPDWFPWLSKAGNDFIAFCIFSAEWYTKTGWYCFFFVGSLNHIFLVLVYLTWLLIWLADWFIKSKRYFYARGACFHTRFPSLARQHVGMLWMHVSHTITHEYCHFHIPTMRTHW